MNIYKKIPIFFYAVLLSLIINDNLYSDVDAPGFRCEINGLNKWDEDTKNNIKQTIGLKEAKYIFLVPEKAIYRKNNTKIIAQSCYYENKQLPIGIGEYHDGETGLILFKPRFFYNSKKKYKIREYRMYIHGDTPLKPVFIVKPSGILRGIKSSMFFYTPGFITSNKSYYFVVIVRTPNKNSEVYSMKIRLK